MSESSITGASKAVPEVTINRDVAAQARQESSAVVARGADVHLRDDPEAKAAFLASFTAEDEKRIMRKVDKRFVILAGIMYLIKQVGQISVKLMHPVLIETRSIKTTQPMSKFCTSASHPISWSS